MGAAVRDFVTVVSGLPRSGTSLVMQMLAAGGLPLLADATRPPDAHNPRGYLEYAPVRRLRQDPTFLEGAVGRAVKVVVPLACALPAALPLADGWRRLRYRIVLVQRDLREVLASQDAMLAGRDPAGLPRPRLAEIFAAQLGELEAWARSQPGVELLRVEHAELLGEPGRSARALADFLGGELDEGAMAQAVVPQLHRQRAGG